MHPMGLVLHLLKCMQNHLKDHLHHPMQPQALLSILLLMGIEGIKEAAQAVVALCIHWMILNETIHGNSCNKNDKCLNDLNLNLFLIFNPLSIVSKTCFFPKKMMMKMNYFLFFFFSFCNHFKLTQI